MKKWILSSIVYLLIVVGAYTAYSFYTDTNTQTSDHGDHSSSEEHDDHDDHDHEEEDGNHADHGQHDGDGESNVDTKVELEGEAITVTLTDKEGNPMDDLEVSHEKLMHLILISEDLEIFNHLHPEKEAPGVFKVEADLEEGMYQVFVDIKPSNLAYSPEPQPLMVGEHAHHDDAHAHLTPDTDWTKKLDQYEVTLEVDNFSVTEDVVLSFTIEGAEPENYLGALGHVVVVDEKLDEFIHVHPKEGDKPVFEAHFSNPGLYKLWAEFKLDGKVYAFPYVIEITE